MSDDLTARIDAALDGTTPGPWRVDEFWDYHPWVRTADGEIAICQFSDFDIGETEDRNALLIAAAPSLLAEARDEITRLSMLVEFVAEPNPPCRVDHDGDCQEHIGMVEFDGGVRLCWNVVARALLDAPSTGEDE